MQIFRTESLGQDKKKILWFGLKHIIHILQETENKERSGIVSVCSNIKLRAVIHTKVILLLLNSAHFKKM